MVRSPEVYIYIQKVVKEILLAMSNRRNDEYCWPERWGLRVTYGKMYDSGAREADIPKMGLNPSVYISHWLHVKSLECGCHRPV